MVDPYALLARSFFFAALSPVRLTAVLLGSGFGDIGVESHVGGAPPPPPPPRAGDDRKPPLHADSARFCDDAPARAAAPVAALRR